MNTSTLSRIAAASLLAAAAAATGLPTQPAGVSIRLLDIQEMRIATINEREDDEFTFMSGDEPGLHLRFEIRLPEGRRLLELEQPSQIQASDSLGTDLSKIPAGFMGEMEFVKVGHAWDDKPPSDFTFRLGLPQRKAETFSIDAEVNALVYASTRDTLVDLDETGVDLDPAMFGGTPVRARLTKSEGFFGGGLGVEITPQSAQMYIHTIAAQAGDVELTSSGYMADGRKIVYMLEGETDQTRASVTFTIRTQLERVPVRINLKDQPLP